MRRAPDRVRVANTRAVGDSFMGSTIVELAIPDTTGLRWLTGAKRMSGDNLRTSRCQAIDVRSKLWRRSLDVHDHVLTLMRLVVRTAA